MGSRRTPLYIEGTEKNHARATVDLPPDLALQSPAGKVASYGSFTRAIQVYQTPTLLIVNPKGQAVAITGITDAFSIEQALDEPPA